MKISSKYKKNKQLLEALAQLLCETCVAVTTPATMKKFLRRSATLTTGDVTELEYSLLFLHAISVAIREKNHKEVFGFSDKGWSGVALTKFMMPKEGYGFFGWIRLEGVYCKSTTAEEELCVWRFLAENEYEVELMIVDRKLAYSVEDLKKKTAKIIVKLSSDLINDKWYFVELYHLSKDSPQNLVLLSIFNNTKISIYI